MSARFGPPPARVRKAHLDNLALLPGSALSQIACYQKMANELPDGSVLIVLPVDSSKQKQALLSVAKMLASEGHQVRVVSAKRASHALELIQSRLDF